MKDNLIKAKHKTAIYRLKEGTTTSYYFRSGSLLLPERIGISKQFEFAKTKRTGRNQHKAIGKIKATFKKKESSRYKEFKPYTIHTNIYKVNEYLLFIGYGSIGITTDSGRIKYTNDLIILFSKTADWKEIEFHFFEGMLFWMKDVFSYLNKLKRH